MNNKESTAIWNYKSHAVCDNLGIDQYVTSVWLQKVVEGGRLQSTSVLNARFERSIHATSPYLLSPKKRTSPSPIEHQATSNSMNKTSRYFSFTINRLLSLCSIVSPF